MPIHPELDDYGWPDVFCETGNNDQVIEPAYPGTTCSLEGFNRDNVIAVLGIKEGENDYNHWMIAVALDDGRFAFCDGWCDYTGWD